MFIVLECHSIKFISQTLLIQQEPVVRLHHNCCQLINRKIIFDYVQNLLNRFPYWMLSSSHVTPLIFGHGQVFLLGCFATLSEMFSILALSFFAFLHSLSELHLETFYHTSLEMSAFILFHFFGQLLSYTGHILAYYKRFFSYIVLCFRLP